MNHEIETAINNFPYFYGTPMPCLSVISDPAPMVMFQDLSGYFQDMSGVLLRQEDK